MVTQDPLNIAFIALSVSGQLNVHLATIEHMLSLSPSESPPLHLHLISFEPAAKRAHALAASHSSGPSTPSPVNEGTANTSRNTLTFHSLGPLSLFTSISANGLIDRHGPASLFARGGLKSYRFLAELFGFNPELYVGVYEHILAIFKEMGRVDVAVVDLTMPIGMDACQTAGVRWGILCPNSGLELSKFDQPRLKGFWKFPAPYSNIAYPAPLHLIPYNIALNFAWLRTLQTHPRIKALEQQRAKAGIKGALLDKPFKQLPFMICASVKEMEYPHVPLHNVVYPGPILVPVPPLSATDCPVLAGFLDKERTIVINMGSNFWYTHEDVEGVLGAIESARTRCTRPFQVLWKLNGKKEFEDVLETRLHGELRDSVRIEEWINPPALAVLQHHNIAAFVSHGGANSVHEAAYAGVPQILLPQWLDLYDYAIRVEWLGHGIYANKGFPAKINSARLSDAFVRILSDEEGGAMKRKALEIAQACQRGGGVDTVAKTIISAIRSVK